MRILMVTPDLPAPPTSGGRVRMFHLIRELGRRNTVDVLAPDVPEAEEVTASKAICRRLMLYPSAEEGPGDRRRRLWRSFLTGRLHHPRADIREALDRVLSEESYDALHFVTPYLFPSLRADTQVPAIVDFFGTSIGIRRELHSSSNPITQLKTLWRYRFAIGGERWTLARAEAAFAISETDRAYFERLAPKARIEVVPNGVDTGYFAPQAIPEEPFQLAFVGDMSFGPNVEGARFLVREILPRLRKEDRRIRVELVGRNPTPEILDLAMGEGVRVTGPVEDVRPFLSRAAVVVIPLLGGSGVRNKTLEAMSMARAIVSTTMGIEGLEALRQGDLELADSPEDFARAVLRLLSSPQRRARMGRDARARVVEQYTWDASARRAEQVYASIARGNPGVTLRV